jgi:hypothetical protein
VRVRRHNRLFLPLCLLASATAGPALADVSLSDTTGTTVTLLNNGTIAFTCKGITHLVAGQEAYLICVDAAPSGSSTSFTGGSTTPTGTVTVPIGQSRTVSATTTVFGGKLGVETFLTWTGGTCTFDITQKIFNKSSDIIRITQYKRIANVDVDGDPNDDTFVGGSTSLTALASDVHTVILSGGGNTGATNALAYSSPAPLGNELGTCALGSGATRLSATGNRMLAVRYNFQPGFVGLKPAGQSGSEKFFSVRYSVQ